MGWKVKRLRNRAKETRQDVVAEQAVDALLRPWFQLHFELLFEIEC